MTDPEPAAMGQDASGGPSGRDYLVRSEEQLQVRTERTVSGYARLEKFVVTETRTVTVEVSHEEFRLVTDRPSPTGSEPRPPDQPGGKNTARWLYLHREEVVITKKVVAVERVGLQLDSVTEQRQFTEPVRRERLDLSGLDTDPAARP